MLEILKNSNKFKAACERAAERAVNEECAVYVAYVARWDTYKVSDWIDDATVCRFDGSSEIEWL